MVDGETSRKLATSLVVHQSVGSGSATRLRLQRSRCLVAVGAFGPDDDDRHAAKGVSYTVRWTVAGREKSRTLARKALAERYRARLIQAADRGEAFDSDTGLPDSLAR
jgi:hypothetical protein